MSASIRNKICKNLKKPVSGQSLKVHQGLCMDLLVLERVIQPIKPKATIRRVKQTDCAEGLNIRIPLDKQKYRIHVEHISKVIHGVNILIPNHELVTKDDLKLLGKMQYVLCKTRYGYNAFKRYMKRKNMLNRVRLIYIGFTGIPGLRPRANIKMNYNQCLHLAGKSWMKNTGVIIDAWKENWPHITIVCVALCEDEHLTTRRKQKCAKLKNITLHTKYLSFQQVANLKKQCGIHFLVSEQEGFGMYIQESMMSGAVCLYSNHPPMNEFFTIGTGIPVKGKTFRHKEGVLPGIMGFRPSSQNITTAINRVMRMTTPQKVAMGKRAQNQFAVTRTKFVTNAMNAFNKILK